MNKRTIIKSSKLLLSIILFGLFIQMLSSCNAHSNISTQQVNKDTVLKKSNPVVYFEIPVMPSES
jgi:hypothetical protein